MIEYKAQENSYLDITDIDKVVLKDLFEIGSQIKSKLGLMSSPIQYISDKRIYIGSIVGNLSLNDTRLVVSPKIPYEESNKTAVVKKLFERTIKCSFGNIESSIYFAKNSVADTDELFIDVLSSIFIKSLTSALRRGKIMQYEEVTEKSNIIKGRILIERQLSQPVIDEKTWCKFNRMSDKNIYNQLLFWACKYLSESVRNFDLKRRLLLLSREFVQDTSLLSCYAVKTLRISRQYLDYMEVLEIAKSLYLNTGGKKETSKTGSQICGYAINMERAFENIVCVYSNAAASKLGLKHKGQASVKFAIADGNYDSDYDIRPDDLFFDGNEHLVMDAKYKVLSAENKHKRKPSREDFYQMISSCIAYNCPEAILVYPLSSNFPSQSWNTVQEVNGKKINIKSIGVDILGDDSDIGNVISQAIKESYIFKEKVV